MPTRGMAADDERPPKPRQLTRCRAHLLDNVAHANAGTKLVAWNGDADAVGVQSSREVAKRGTAQRLPIAAMNKNRDRAAIIPGKKINDVPRAGTVGNRARGVPLAIGRGVLCPSGQRTPRPIASGTPRALLPTVPARGTSLIFFPGMMAARSRFLFMAAIGSR